MISTTGSAINARDFNKNTKDADRDNWISGAMHHLVKALNGAPVAIVLDKHTGFTEVNVTLGGVRQTPGYGTFQVLVQRTFSDGQTGGCWYPLFKVGAVIELGNSRARWTALEAYGEEQTLACRKLQDEMVSDLGVADRYALPSGKWEARVFPGFVHASYDPQSYTAPVSYRWKRYESKDLANA